MKRLKVKSSDLTLDRFNGTCYVSESLQSLQSPHRCECQFFDAPIALGCWYRVHFP